MARSTHAARSAAAWSLARRQHWVLTRPDLDRLGYSREAIDHRVESARLHLVARGIYVVGRRELTPHGRWMAAVLACGDGAALSHASAAALWGIASERQGPIHVSIRRRSRLARPGITVHARPSLGAGSFTHRHGIPVTSIVQTLIDLATELPPLRLERSVNEADKLDLVDPETLRRSLDDHTGMPGVKTLRVMLDRHTFRFSDSDLEILFRPLAMAAGLPLPLTKHTLLGFEADFYFPDYDLVVETDGLRYHRTPSQQARAARRDQVHTAAGFKVLRFTHWQVVHAPDEVTATLSQTTRT